MSHPYPLTRTSYLDFCPCHFPSQSDIFLSKMLLKFNYNILVCYCSITVEIGLNFCFNKIRAKLKVMSHLVTSKPFLANVRLVFRQGHRLTDTENSKEVQKSVILQENHYFEIRAISIPTISSFVAIHVYMCGYSKEFHGIRRLVSP